VIWRTLRLEHGYALNPFSSFGKVYGKPLRGGGEAATLVFNWCRTGLAAMKT